MELIIRYDNARQFPVEVVERKGLGHPDTICDALAERVCVELCRYYLHHFGTILHHNVDKILLCGGVARPAFGGGQVDEPIELYLTGRVTSEYEGRSVPVAEIAVQACRQWLRQHLPALDLDRHVRIMPRFRPGSSALRGLFRRAAASVAVCNDTSSGAGFAPLTPLENAVLDIETVLNSASIKQSYPAMGQDIKVMGVRHGSKTHLIVACAMIDRHLSGTSAYKDATAVVRQIALDTARPSLEGEIDMVVNAADDIQAGDVYLTVTGTSAESGDDGEVGRGNRVCGLITPYRPMTLEAAAGKNPVNHVGKLYNLAAQSIAKRTAELLRVRSATCVLVGQVGRPIDDPELVDLLLEVQPDVRVKSDMPAPPNLDSAVQTLLDGIVRGELSRFPQVVASILEESQRLY